MARYLPKKKYLSKLHGDSSGDGQLLQDDGSPFGLHHDDSTAASFSNRSDDGSETAISAEYRLGHDLSSSNSLRSSAGELKGLGSVGSRDSLYRDDLLHDPDIATCAEVERTDVTESRYSPVYFVREPFDEIDPLESQKLKLPQDKQCSNGSVQPDCHIPLSNFAHDDEQAVVSDKSLHTMESSDMAMDCDCLPLKPTPSALSVPSVPSLSSFASLAEAEVLGGLLTSSESFASFLSGLDSKDGTVPNTESGRLRNLIAGIAEGRPLSAEQEQFMQYDLCMRRKSTENIASSTVPPVDGSPTAVNHKESLDLRSASSFGVTGIITSSDEGTRVKEEQFDMEYEKKEMTLITTSGRNRGRGKANEPKFECQVCGDVAAGYHCGAYVCEACKKFYLRCLKMGDSPSFVCPKNNNCEISKETRSHCQFCRFKKCMQLGMYRPGCEDDKKLKVDFRSISCKVCNAPSSGFHFGAITCEGCKGFFRRMLKEQLHKKFVCTNGETCDIDSANRTNCKSCRFAKCLRVGMTLEGTRLGRQSNSVKLSTLMQYQGPGDGTKCRLSESSGDDFEAMAIEAAMNVMKQHEQDSRDIVDDCYSDSEPGSSEIVTPMRSFSDAASLVAVPRGSGRRRSDTDAAANFDAIAHSDYSGKSGPLPDRKPPLPKLTLPIAGRDAPELLHPRPLSDEGRYSHRENQGTSKAGNLSHLPAARVVTTAPPIGVVLQMKNDPGAQFVNHTGSGMTPTLLPTADKYPVSSAVWPERHPATNSNRYTSPPATAADLSVPRLISPPVYQSFEPSISGGPCPGSSAFAASGYGRVENHHVSNAPHSAGGSTPQYELVEQQRRRFADHSICTPPQEFASSSVESNEFQQLAANSAEAVEQLFVGPAVQKRMPEVKQSPPIDGTQAEIDLEQVVFDDPMSLFTYLVDIFRELDEIMNRPVELDDIRNSPASMESLWKLVEIPFMHQAKIVLRFIKKIPGFRQLPVDDQIKMAQDSVYPVTLIFHSRYYNLETGAYNWFINTPQERDLVLGILPPFAALGSHFSSTGFAMKQMLMEDFEMAFLSVMAILTAAEGSYLQSVKEVLCLQNYYLEAFISYCRARNSPCRLSPMLTRLPELKRANIEHCLIAAQIQQMTPQTDMGCLWREMFLSSGVTS